MCISPSQQHSDWPLSPTEALLHPPCRTWRLHGAEWTLSTVAPMKKKTRYKVGEHSYWSGFEAAKLFARTAKQAGVTFVILVCWASMSRRMRTVCAWPSRAAMCRGVWPAVVVELGFALCSSSSFTSSLWPIRAAQWRGVWSSWPTRGRTLWNMKYFNGSWALKMFPLAS